MYMGDHCTMLAYVGLLVLRKQNLVPLITAPYHTRTEARKGSLKGRTPNPQTLNPISEVGGRPPAVVAASRQQGRFGQGVQGTQGSTV